MRIRPGGPGDIAAVLALGDEAVTYGFSRVQKFTVALPAGPWPGMLLAMRLTSHPSQAALPAAGGRLRLGGQPDVFLPVQQAVQAGRQRAADRGGHDEQPYLAQGGAADDQSGTEAAGWVHRRAG